MPEALKPAFPLDRDQSVVEMVELVTGETGLSPERAWATLSSLTITEEAMRLFGWLGLSTLVALTRRGDRRSAEALVDRALGLPDKPYREQVAGLDAGQAADKLLELLLSMGVEPKKARDLVEKRAAKALAAHGGLDGR